MNGNYSCWMNVLSAIRQGSVLGSILFIIFINDLADVVQVVCVLFTDDTKEYGPVGNEEYRASLQEDLNDLLKWSNEWQLKFNTIKCKAMHYGRGNRHNEYRLESTTEEKHLGVIFIPVLKFSRQVAMAPNKANHVIGAIRIAVIQIIYGWAYVCTVIQVNG